MKASRVLITVLLLIAAAHATNADQPQQELHEANETLSSSKSINTPNNNSAPLHHHDHSHSHQDEGDHGHEHSHEHHDHNDKNAPSSKVVKSDSSDDTSVFHLWLYGTGAVIFISIAGLLAITTIPKIASHHHGDILQLLVGLAIGTLTSDALLHLLPHAFSGATHEHRAHTDDDTSSHSHSHRNESADHSHTQNVWNGLMALMGIIGFLAFERILTIVSDLCSKSNRTKVSSCDREPGEKGDHHSHNHKENLLLPESEKIPEKHCEHNEKDQVGKDAIDQVSCMNVGPDAPLTTEQCHRETMVYQHPDPDRGYVIQLMDHHHHHQHGSTSQKGAKSVIYMIITGDGLHNFFDGLAIGIAFAGGISGGISTSVAVLCHELPHEVGDFAVLLKAGLAAKKAVMYNTLSAFLCFIGMTVGVLVANMDTGMLSSIIAGMFLYIALVDMIPQLDCCPTATGTTRAFKLTVQLFGMGIGVTIMSIISIYEPALQRIMS